MTTKLQQFCIDILPVIQAGAKGARIGVQYLGDGELEELNPPAEVGFASFNKYQVIRDMIDVNGFKVPAGEKVAPEYGDYYYFPQVLHTALYDKTNYTREPVDKIRFTRGLVYLNKEDAIARAKAMLGIDPYAEEEFDDAGDIPE